MKHKKISVLGMGYIGLPTSIMLASRGFDVVGYDIKKEVVDSVNAGLLHFVEPGLEDALKQVIDSNNLVAKNELKESDVYIICVPTPVKEAKDNSSLLPDLSYVFSAVENIAKVLKNGDLIILESTSPVGTTQKICDFISDLRKDLKMPNDDCEGDVCIAYCPERVMPGNVIFELVENDRVVGGISKQCSIKAAKLYESFLKGNCYKTNARTAEMAKLTENSSRDNQIAFANEVSMVCDKNDINVWELIDICNKHPRVNILQPGPGVGGHCIAVDPWFIISNNLTESQLIRKAREVNLSKTMWTINKIKEKINSIKSAPNVVIFGITFKPNIDDVRESPALKITEELIKNFKDEISVVEPNIKEPPEVLNDVKFFQSISEVNFKIDLAIVLVDHSDFLQKDYFKKAVEILDFKGIS